MKAVLACGFVLLAALAVWAALTAAPGLLPVTLTIGAAPPPTATELPLPTFTPATARQASATAAPTRPAGTLSPYSVDPNSVTPDPAATRYVAPGRRTTPGAPPPAVTPAGSGGGSIMVLVTPYPIVTATPPVITAPPISIPVQPKIEAPPPEPPAPPSAPVRISGRGDDVIAVSASGAAVRVFSMQHAGSSNFAIVLYDSQGGYEDLLVNEIGPYTGKKSAALGSGRYFLDITADGPWTVEISPSVAQVSPTSGNAPLSLSGSGDDVVSFSATGTGLRIFSIKYSGSSNFAIKLLDSRGGYVDLLVNEIGSYSGRRSAQLTTGGYLLDVTASGPWTIEVAS